MSPVSGYSLRLSVLLTPSTPGYRAELYNRLETKRLKSMKKQIQRSERLGSSDEENKDVNAVVGKLRMISSVK